MESTTGTVIGSKERALIISGADEIALVRSGLEDTMILAYHEMREIMRRKPDIKDLRTAAFYSATQKISISYQSLGIFP